jgi:ribosomal protein S18 acetylase RimI-like enzyme
MTSPAYRVPRSSVTTRRASAARAAGELDAPARTRYTDAMAVAIREFTLDDYDAAYALWSASEGVGLSQADEPHNVARFLERNPGSSFVAVDQSRVIGAVLCGNDGRRGFLHHLAVDRDYRREGVGRRLVQCCLEALSAAGMRKCHIFVLADNVDGQGFWRSIGWEERTTLKVMSRDVPNAPGTAV